MISLQSNEVGLLYDLVESKVGTVVMAASDKGLRYVSFCDAEVVPLPSKWVRDKSLLAEATSQMRAYLSGGLQRFSLALDPLGTDFQRQVWQALTEIPYGQTVTYGGLARRIGNSQASRAVGNANGRNPLVIVQPCHRVIAANNTIGGFSSGLFRKRFLLQLERNIKSIR